MPHSIILGTVLRYRYASVATPLILAAEHILVVFTAIQGHFLSPLPSFSFPIPILLPFS